MKKLNIYFNLHFYISENNENENSMKYKKLNYQNLISDVIFGRFMIKEPFIWTLWHFFYTTHSTDLLLLNHSPKHNIIFFKKIKYDNKRTFFKVWVCYTNFANQPVRILLVVLALTDFFLLKKFTTCNEPAKESQFCLFS